MKPVSLLCILLIIAGCTSKTGTPTTITPSFSEEKTKEVLDHHWKAFQQNDLDGTMADYTEESVLITPDVTYKGLSEIRKNFEKAFAAFPKDSTTMTLDKSIVVKEVAYITWKAKTPAFELSFGTDTFIVQDGKIVRQTYAGVAK
jgi:major membrane immunogen (membrane-anchored lipoprotein)